MFEKIHGDKKIQLILGLIIGIFFGFLLQKGGATNYNIIINQLLLRDFTIIKIMLTAVVTGMIGVYILKGFNKIKLHPKPFYLKGIVLGGLIFGVGFALLGYCPGTGAGALGTGSIHALFGIIGMILGSLIFSRIYPSISQSLQKKEKEWETIPQALGTNPWTIIIPITTIYLVFIYFLEFF